MRLNRQSFRFLNPTLLSLLLILPSCGYRSCDSAGQITLSIPYVDGDEEGFLTAALIAELSRTGLYDYVSSKGELELRVALVSSQEEVVGFRYDRTRKKGRIESNLMATENRRHVAAEVTLLKASEIEPILGPVVVTASAEYDYIDVSTLQELAFTNSHGRRVKVIDFSQGQLDSIEGAQDNALTPLYGALAKKIATLVHRFYFKP